MPTARPLLPPPVWKRRTERRLGGRLMVTSMGCRLGRIIDISAGGLRVRGLALLPLTTYGRMTVRISGLACPVEVEVEVAWINHCGILRREVGLAFSRVDSDAMVLLLPLFRAAQQIHRRSA